MIVDRLQSNAPRVHLIDTEYFKQFPTDYGIHQAYAQQMGIVSSASDFVNQMYGSPRARTLMAFTLYNFTPQSIKALGPRGASWVLQNRRYRFRDSAQSFAGSLDKSARAILASFPLVLGMPHFITYEADGSFRRPNRNTTEGRADIAALASLGYETLSENEMVEAVGAHVGRVQVHNPTETNEAIGYVKIIEDKNDIEQLTPQHIAIFKSLPDRIPPVAAIVTLEGQTPLAHINVLAINRGTLNVAVNEGAQDIIQNVLTQATQMTDRPVKLSVRGETIALTLTSAESVAAFQAELKRKIGRVEIPASNTSTSLEVVKPTAAHTVAEIGAKAANYGRIERLLGNDLVWPGYAIGFSLYRNVVTSGGSASIENSLILPLLAKVRAGELSPAQVNLELEKIRQAILEKKIPAATLASLVQLARHTDFSAATKMRFRSSTNCEDLPRFNGAGLYLSEGVKLKHVQNSLNDSGAQEKLRETLMTVVGSLWLPQAFWEREYFSIDHGKAAMAIQINPAFTDEAANGVMVISKSSNNRYSYWINSQRGEASVTNPVDGQIPESVKLVSSAVTSAALKAELERTSPSVEARSNVGSVFVLENGALDPTRVDLLTQTLLIGKRILDALVSEPDKFGIDIEYKLVDFGGAWKLVIKQARPLRLGAGH